MKFTRLFGKTYREVPREVKSRSNILLLKGGFIHLLGKGLVSFLPLGFRVLQNLISIIRKEMEGLGGQEVNVPFVNPYSIWEKSGRSELLNEELVNFKDRTGHRLILAPTHEEAMVELAHSELFSYRDLPVFLYQFQSKFRDEERVRFGLLRAREFLMKDGYSFHRSYSDLNNFFPKVFEAYNRIFKKCNVDIFCAEAGVGYMGGEKSYEFLMPWKMGDNIAIHCDNCNYTANKDIAVGIKETMFDSSRDSSGLLNELKKVDTPNCETMSSLSAFMSLPQSSLIKSMVYKTKSGLVMAVVRGDYEVSHEKLIHYIDEPSLKPAMKRDLEESGLIPGYLSPLGIDSGIKIVVDDAVTNAVNLVCGANEEGKHYINVNYGRDFEVQCIADIARIKEKDRCRQCGSELKEIHAIELGNIFKLGDFYSRSMDLYFHDDYGKKVYPQMGSYGIGTGRLISAIVESNSDDKGIVWPINLAPFRVFLMGIGKSAGVKRILEKLYREIKCEVLFDDRSESPGVKFKDADLIGIPIRILVTTKYLEDGLVEFYSRKTGKIWTVPIDKVSEEVENYEI